MKPSTALILIFSSFILLSCKPHSRELKILDKAESLNDTLPKESYTTLLKIKNIENLPDSIRAKYHYLLSNCAISTGINIKSDSGINQAINYYQYKKDTLKLNKALINKALIKHSQQNYTASNELLKLSNNLLKGSEYKTEIIKNLQLIGFNELLLKQYDSAIVYQKKALLLAKDLNDTLSIIEIIINLAESNQLNNKNLEAIDILENALFLSEKINNNDYLKTIFEQLYIIYEKQENYEKAMYYLTKIRESGMKRENIQLWNLTKAILFDKQSMPDSVYKYSIIALNGNDPFIAAVAYSILANKGIRQGRFAEALNYEKKINLFFDSFTRNIKSEKSRLDYEKEKIETENNILKIKQKEKNLIILTILLLILILLISLYILNLKQKKNHIEREILLLKQTNEISQLREKEAMLRISLLRRINLSKKFPSLSDNNINDETSKTNSGKIILTENEWEELINDINEAYPHFTESLKKSYPKLNNDDIRFCCLLKINVDLQDISDIYCLSKGSITKRKYRLKKDKFGVDNPDLSLDNIIQKI